ncbi:MAG TPA: VWA domain-containing protein [Spirochaetota bacterium]|nr:VWA domain-containing protein [Spirochaetota bacterium]
MKRFFALFLLISFLSIKGFASPFISINSVDATKDFPKVKVFVTVSERDGKGISSVDERNFQIYEDGYMVNYVRLKDISPESDPLYLVIAIDSSKSISPQFFEKIKLEAKNMLSLLSKSDRVCLLKFNDEVELKAGFGSTSTELLSAIKNLQRHGSQTKLYDAIYDAVELAGNSKSQRRAVLVWTDGKDEGSSIRADDSIKFSKDLSVPVYFITSQGKNSREIARIARLTGGLTKSVEKNNLTEIYSSLISRMKSIYEITYISMADRSKSDHKLEVRFRSGEIRDRDEVSFKIKSGLPALEFPDGTYIIISGLVASLLIVSFLLLFVLLKKKKEKYMPGDKNQKEKSESYFTNIYSNIPVESLLKEEKFDENAALEVPDSMYSNAWLQKKDDGRVGEKFSLLKGEATIGTGSENTIQIDDDFASNVHARIRRIEGGYYLYDLISDRGTFLNGKKILRPKLLRNWDEIRVGNTTFIFRGTK